jgi:hypothetical protein
VKQPVEKIVIVPVEKVVEVEKIQIVEVPKIVERIVVEPIIVEDFVEVGVTNTEVVQRDNYVNMTIENQVIKEVVTTENKTVQSININQIPQTTKVDVES